VPEDKLENQITCWKEEIDRGFKLRGLLEKIDSETRKPKLVKVNYYQGVLKPDRGG